MNDNKYGLRLQTLRKKQGLTQDNLAKILHTSRSRIANYEQGKRQPDFEMQEAIADYFNVTIDYLFGREYKGMSYDSDKVDKAIELYDRIQNLTPANQTALLTLLESLQKGQ